MLTEGGIRVPLIARWPGTVPAGTTADRNIHCLDFYPTCLDLAGRQWEPSTDDHPLDGESFATVLLNPNSQPPRGPIFYLFPGYMDSRAQPTVVAIDRVNGKTYKLFYYYESNSWELYCLTDDPGETKNPKPSTNGSRKNLPLGGLHFPLKRRTVVQLALLRCFRSQNNPLSAS